MPEPLDREAARIPSGRLLEAARTTRDHAARSGALQPILTRTELIEDGGAAFVVRVVSDAPKRAWTRTQRRTGKNPFAPCDPDLLVGAVGERHLCVLNKFPVFDLHLLLVTREFEPQHGPLTLADFEALCACMAEADGLGFYNAGAVAGASQPHKHLQFVPGPIGVRGERAPIETFLELPGLTDRPTRRDAAGFAHRVMRAPVLEPRRWLSAYRALCAALDLDPAVHPYNLLATRDWAMVVPRRREKVGGMSVNALGFAGSLFARDERDLGVIRRIGPRVLLAEAAGRD